MKILITGGAGYIGSTIASALEDSGHTPILLNSLITGRIEFTRGRIFYYGDIADTALLETVFREHPEIEACIHCAALIVVPTRSSAPMSTTARTWPSRSSCSKTSSGSAATGLSSAPPPLCTTPSPATWSPRPRRSSRSARMRAPNL